MTGLPLVCDFLQEVGFMWKVKIAFLWRIGEYRDTDWYFCPGAGSSPPQILFMVKYRFYERGKNWKQASLK